MHKLDHTNNDVKESHRRTSKTRASKQSQLKYKQACNLSHEIKYSTQRMKNNQQTQTHNGY